MSSESSESDIFFSAEDVESTEFSTCSDDFSDSGSNSDLTASDRQSVNENETEEFEVTEVVTTSLNTRGEKHHELDFERSSLRSLEDTSPKDLNGTRKSSKDRQANALTWNTSSRIASSLDALNGPSTGNVSFVDPLEGPSSRMDSSLDFLKEPSTRGLSSLDPLEGPSSRLLSSLDSLNGPSSGSLSSVDPLEGPSSRITSSLDPLAESSTRRVSSMNPLEGPSTQIVWFSDPTEDSPASICKSLISEVERNETSDSVPLNASCSRTLANFYWRASRQIRRSKCYLLFNMALLALPFSAAYMGSRYEKLCHACPELPMKVLGLGCFGVVMMTFRIASILSKYHFIPPMVCRCFNVLLMSAFLPFIPFLLKEIGAIYSCDPVFTPSKANKKFCIKVFYDYAYYLNKTIPLVIILLFLIHIPGWFDTVEDEEQ